MKKIVMVLIVAALCCTSVFAFGIGVQGGGTISGNGFGGGAAITFKLDSAPWVFAVDASFGNSSYIGISADNWVVNKALASPLNYFIGWGIGGSLGIGNSFNLNLVGRIPLGLNLFIANKIIEPYLQAVPSFGVHIGSTTGFYWAIPLNIGLRFWFN